jgi:ABC-type phosphate transport system substrate-binding protein
MPRRSAILGLLLAVLGACPARASDLVVVVHPERQVELSAAEVAQIFLRKRRFWSDGKAIVPVHRESESEARRLFRRTVFGESARQLIVYWNRQYFRGLLPPATLASDEAVKRFVAAERRAIGYIAADLIDDSLHVVLRIFDEPDRQ